MRGGGWEWISRTESLFSTGCDPGEHQCLPSWLAGTLEQCSFETNHDADRTWEALRGALASSAAAGSRIESSPLIYTEREAQVGNMSRSDDRDRKEAFHSKL